MIRLWGILLLSLTMLIQPAPRSARIILVVPPGETLTEAERGAYRAQAQAALDWWQAHAPVPMPYTPGATEVITPGVDVYHELRSWSLPYLTEDNPDLTIFLIDNSESLALLFDDSGGEAQPYYGAVWVVMNGVPSAGAIITHEIGHVSYRLEHPEPCMALDIMCYQGMVTTYHMGFVGCASLATLGAPCQHAYLPMVAR